jgi:RNA polymerase sigma-B factor
MSCHPDDQSIVSTLIACQSASPAERAVLEAEVVATFLPMTRALARRYRLKGVELEDLEQVAGLALVRAIRRFDPDAGNLRGYLTATVIGELKKYFRDHAWSVRPSRQVQDLQSQVMDALSELHDDIAYQSRIGLVAQSLGISRALVNEVLLARGGFRSLSLDRATGDGGLALHEVLADESDPYLETERRSFLTSVCGGLEESELELLRLRFVEQLSQREIAEQVHSTQKQVSRSLERILGTLRQRALSEAA